MLEISAEYWAVIVSAAALVVSNVWKSVELRRASRIREERHEKEHLELGPWIKDMSIWRTEVDRQQAGFAADIRTAFQEIRDVLLALAKRGID